MQPQSRNAILVKTPAKLHYLLIQRIRLAATFRDGEISMRTKYHGKLRRQNILQNGTQLAELMTMKTIKAKDGTELFYKDWGQGQAVVFSHGWPLNSDNWESQMLFLASRGYRCIAHDRRGHGRSTQTWEGNEMDTYADDLADVLEALNADGALRLRASDQPNDGGQNQRHPPKRR